MPRKTKPTRPRSLTKARGREIERLTGLARVDAIVHDMFRPPRKRRRNVFGRCIEVDNHNTALARLIGVTARSVRAIRQSGIITDRLLDRLTAEWKLRRRRDADLKGWYACEERKKARTAKVRAIQEKGIEAVMVSRHGIPTISR
jgi:hypothetical protein